MEDSIKIIYNDNEINCNKEIYDLIKNTNKSVESNKINNTEILDIIPPKLDIITPQLENRLSGSLLLKDGSEYKGYLFGSSKSISGEVVFNTSMVGYPESLTDPSYYGQILVLTYPSIGNYGIPSFKDKDEYGLLKYFESNKIHLSGIIISNYSNLESHWNSFYSLDKWLKENDIPGLYDIDTRDLTIKLRNQGLMLGKIQISGQDDIEWFNPNTINLVEKVSTSKSYILNETGFKTVMVIDCGIKNNILRQLLSYNLKLIVVPYNYNFNELINEIDGLFISNGPGNPQYCDTIIENLKYFLTNNKSQIPIFAICLGHQLLSLAIGCNITKLKYGNRSINQPCIDITTGKCHMTAQNHSYVVNENTIPINWSQLFYNANDNSNEGIIHNQLPYMSVQFHPEAKGGPSDTQYLFQTFISNIKREFIKNDIPKWFPKQKYNTILLLGSGGLTIGQAGEFDYSGSQAIKALKEYNIRIILINPNIATVQTSDKLVDKIYFYPIKKQYIEQVIKIEQPDGILISFGGQTALNAGIELYKEGLLEKYHLKVIGTPIETIIKTEDRVIFSNEMRSINEPISQCKNINTIQDGINIAKEIGYPIMVRTGFALGGLGSFFAENEEELVVELRKMDLNKSILIEKSIKGWKEIEYEVVRDQYDNCITICNMENFDPIGVHTGDSIVVAPSQTLSNDDFYMLRSASIKIIRHLGVIGECNIQFALNPNKNEYCVIEVNARLSRSSALASKATGYPLAYIGAKLGLGENLSILRNNITETTTACYEPSLDYLVIKIPRWDLSKFNNVNQKIGSSMMSVGEVMAIGRNFEETLQKAIRMVDDSKQGFQPLTLPNEIDIIDMLKNPSPLRLYILYNALQQGYTISEIHKLTHIDIWFLSKLENIYQYTNAMKHYSISNLPIVLLKEAKKIGFSDNYISKLVSSNELAIRQYRISNHIIPYIKQIDTTAGEFPTNTNYLYSTYNAISHDIEFNNHNSIIVLGCGVYRIGSSVEFDWCAVSCIRKLKQNSKYTIVINYNPETVSTDYDESDRLYFEEISLERVLDIYQLENPEGVIISVGGQTPNNIALDLNDNNVTILGTQPKNIDRAEDRFKFSKLLDTIKIEQPKWEQITNLNTALSFCNSVEYPCLIRPSYVLSGASMKIVNDGIELEDYLNQSSTLISNTHPVVISKFMEEHKEIEIDAIADKGKLICYGISEHLENAGVHSGDATLILPAQKLYFETIRRIKKATRMIAKELEISGPFNIQFLSKDNHIKVIECNLRASRSFPFVSKSFGVNFIEIATSIMLDIPYEIPEIKVYDMDYVCVKVPMFSFSRLPNSDNLLGVEMSSTGEVACLSDNVKDAYLHAMVASGFIIPKENILIIIDNHSIIYDLLKYIQKLIQAKYTIYSNTTTNEILQENNIYSIELENPIKYITSNKIELVINIPNKENQEYEFNIRRTAIENNIPILTNIKTTKLMISSLYNQLTINNRILHWKKIISNY